MKKLFTIKGLILLAIGLFAILNITWFTTTKVYYSEFLEAVPKHKTGVHVMKKDGFSYNVKAPDYLSYVGNLGIVHPNKESALIIWPEIFGEDKYGFRLQKDGEAYEIMLNNNLEPLNNDKLTNEIVESKREEIDELMNRARSVFPID